MTLFCCYQLLLLSLCGWMLDLYFNGDLLECPHGDLCTADATTWMFDGVGDVYDELLQAILSLIVLFNIFGLWITY